MDERFRPISDRPLRKNERGPSQVRRREAARTMFFCSGLPLAGRGTRALDEWFRPPAGRRFPQCRHCEEQRDEAVSSRVAR